MSSTALRSTSLALILFACGIMGSVRADDLPPRANATTPAGQKGAPGEHAGQAPKYAVGGRAASPAAGLQHQANA